MKGRERRVGQRDGEGEVGGMERERRGRRRGTTCRGSGDVFACVVVNSWSLIELLLTESGRWSHIDLETNDPAEHYSHLIPCLQPEELAYYFILNLKVCLHCWHV